MNRLIKILPMVLIVLFLLVPCAAEDGTSAQGTSEPEKQSLSELFEEQLDASGARELYDETPDDAKRLLGGIGVDELDYKTLLSLSPSDFFCALWEVVLDTIQRPLVILAAITGVAVLCAIVDSLKTGLGGTSMETLISIVAVLCIGTAVIGPIIDCVRLAAEAIQACSEFILAFIPVFISLVAAGGQPASATAYNGMMLFLSQIISSITTNLLVPLIGVYLAFCLIGAIMPESGLDGAAKAAKSVVTWCLGLFVTIFVGLLGLQSLVAAGADSVTMRTGKFLISSFVPVVGKALSDALATAQGCVRLLKTTVGVYAVFAAAFCFLPAMVQSAVWYCAAGIGSAVCDALGVSRVAKVLRACGGALGMLLGIITFVALLFIVSTTVMLVTGTGAGA